ncbi:hypothetical protein N7468_006471 [Penicillium chermesinum]|uniref:Peptide hydrolase n=1 Tax=Penicillium chermesinum TaxID=63820 RepID=A0A9W9TJN5_9EURO|nr:uncharacterized protein N7468_006471 [Penicillium chermesinum]KAJ5225246.1 hypothetical protein N7468_006471 [Penicillium chermesinum]KAJ6140554.1 hypothetical protein N7470_010350 [Penicillium chermesinum]
MFPAFSGLCGHFLALCLGLSLVLTPIQAYQQLSDDTLRALSRPGDEFDIHNGAVLSPFLQPRVPGTSGHAAVLEHMVKYVQTTLPKWEIAFQNSTSKTPVTGNKDIPFVNLIARRDPPGVPVGDIARLTLVAHYDSKLEPEGFIGAIDSAAPCAMLLHAMRNIDEALTQKWATAEEHGIDMTLEETRGIQIIFLDGEEAFQHWTATDSLYGARSLAESWDSTINPAMSTFKTELASIEMFVLLDLLGSKDPYIQSFYPTTHWAYRNLGDLERRLRAVGQFKSSGADPWFVDTLKTSREVEPLGGLQDDHIPFLVRGVDVVHVIDFTPHKGFPSVWHTIEDDGEHLDMPTVEDWSVLVAGFAAEWMELEGHMPTADAPGRETPPRDQKSRKITRTPDEPKSWRRKPSVSTRRPSFPDTSWRPCFGALRVDND